MGIEELLTLRDALEADIEAIDRRICTYAAQRIEHGRDAELLPILRSSQALLVEHQAVLRQIKMIAFRQESQRRGAPYGIALEASHA